MTATRKGYRRCQGRCGRNRAVRFFKPRGRVCSTCRRRRVSVASREVRLLETYGITVAEYEQMAKDGCNICGGIRRGNLDVDHDHAEEKRLLALGWEPTAAARASVRGALCRSHNRRLLPSAKDDPALLRAAALYLEHPPARLVLGVMAGTMNV